MRVHLNQAGSIQMVTVHKASGVLGNDLGAFTVHVGEEQCGEEVQADGKGPFEVMCGEPLTASWVTIKQSKPRRPAWMFIAEIQIHDPSGSALEFVGDV